LALTEPFGKYVVMRETTIITAIEKSTTRPKHMPPIDTHAIRPMDLKKDFVEADRDRWWQLVSTSKFGLV
jgi:hypothetical protein